eukprot:3780843-Pyramimonas_sp.AAC.1
MGKARGASSQQAPGSKQRRHSALVDALATGRLPEDSFTAARQGDLHLVRCSTLFLHLGNTSCP